MWWKMSNYILDFKDAVMDLLYRYDLPADYFELQVDKFIGEIDEIINRKYVN